MLVSWNTTNECNLTCRHCYRDAGVKKAEELSTAEGLALIDEIARAGFKIMIFSGGEPLLREDILQLVQHAKSRGLIPVFGSNGTLLTGDLARRLKEAGAAAIGISLDSPRAGAHDDFRGMPGAWQGAVDGMMACREAGLPFQVHTTAMRWNAGEITELTDWAQNNGAKAHHVFFLVPIGRGLAIEDESLPPDRYEQLLRQLMAKSSQVPIEIKPTCAPQFVRIARQMGVETRFGRGCLAGLSYCIISPVGDVQACAYLDVAAGNVRRSPFSQIWRESPLLQALRTKVYGGRCGTCSFGDLCGGCRARAHYLTGDYLGGDEWCLYRQGTASHG
ncbi:MAG TPA: putative heme d1 biosynthesis radical SAM protein NirJ2 [Spirochaetia bacterium]|nr:putative heme d1 biosynthesis radical SAM protein NirJ2 [Spirochaetia bacterium]